MFFGACCEREEGCECVNSQFLDRTRDSFASCRGMCGIRILILILGSMNVIGQRRITSSLLRAPFPLSSTSTCGNYSIQHSGPYTSISDRPVLPSFIVRSLSARALSPGFWPLTHKRHVSTPGLSPSLDPCSSGDDHCVSPNPSHSRCLPLCICCTACYEEV
jgi:hypothetical protein